MALLLTLGILSLVLILAMSFAFTARTERMAAAVNADVVKARLLCESGLQRAIATVQYNYRLDTNGNGTVELAERTNVYPGAGLTAWGNYNLAFSLAPFPATPHGQLRMSGLDNLRTVFTRASPGPRTWGYIPVDPTADEDVSVPDNGDGFYSVLPAFGWVPILVDEPNRHNLDGTGNVDKLIQRLTGRLAYVIIDESGRIDPSAVLNNNEGAAAAETTRPGDSITEIDLHDVVWPGAGGPNNYTDFADNLWADTDPTRRFLAWRDLYVATSVDMTDAEMANMVDRLCPFGHPEPVSCRQLLHQLDLSLLGVAPYVGVAGVNQLLTEVPWLLYWADADCGTFATGPFPNPAPRAKQIAANLIDYCDGGSSPTHDSVVTLLPPPAMDSYPTYIGLEKVPFINDIRVKVMNASSLFAVNDYGDRRLSVAVTVELVNMFDVALGAGCALEMELEVTFDWQDQGTGAWTNGAVDTVQSGAWVATVGGVPAHSYLLSAEGTADVVVLGDPAVGDIPEFRNVIVKITKLFLREGSAVGDPLWDCAMTAAAAPMGPPAPGPYFLPGVPSYYARAETDDPRQNINELDWTWVVQNSTLAGDYNLAAGKNAGCNPNSGGARDLENAAADPWDVSSVYIRNGPMTSLAEVGIIHRGAAWETLNLAKYSIAAGGVAGGARRYSDGDRNILDDVRTRTVMETPHLLSAKVNINTPRQEVLDAVFRNIRVGDQAHYPGEAGGTVLTDAEATALASTVLAVNATPMSGPQEILVRMGDKFYDEQRDATPLLTALNDRKVEVALVHTNALMSTKYSEFSILVIAQSIQDMLERASDPGKALVDSLNHTDDDGDEAGYGYYDTAAVIAGHTAPAELPVKTPDRVLAEQKIYAQVTRNGLDAGLEADFTDNQSGETFTYLGKYPRTGHRYYLSTNAATWLAAQRICETNGGYLVTINDDAVNGVAPGERTWLQGRIGALALPLFKFWIGLYQVGDPGPPAPPFPKFAWVTTEPFCPTEPAPPTATYQKYFPLADFWKPGFPGEPTVGSPPSGPAASASVCCAVSTTCQADADYYYTSLTPYVPVQYRFVMECEPTVIVERYEFLEE
ncbi:MAG: hypothetical protein A3K18_21315 [Lentisphaerae bacterium RIFOXYA12_64_32]|nr:MAG: hypothetical protein A3K18_21315 [Lentisphaerae bacterium RIFOXYA12_64_32]